MAGLRKLFFAGLAIFFSFQHTQAQSESTELTGDFGISLGAAHYFGDLNPNAKLNRPKIAAGAFFRKQFGNYVALRINAHFAKLGYSDIYNMESNLC